MSRVLLGPRTAHGLRLITSTSERASLSERTRMLVTIGAVVLLHFAGVLLLGLAGGGLAALLALAVVAYGRGLVHALDFDHVSMIDNSIRSFVAEGRAPLSVGLAFSAGHSTVVLVTSALVIAGFSAVTTALDADSALAQVLGVIGLAVSGAYLLFCACINLPRLRGAIRTYRAFDELSDAERSLALRGRAGPLTRLMTVPLRWVRHPRHVYLMGFAFSLGFDTSSQIGLLVVVAGATISGVAPLALMALPVLFTAAITLVDTLNGMFMVRLYSTATAPGRRMIGWNIAITSLGVLAALAVAVLAASELLAIAGWTGPADALAWFDGQSAGIVFVALTLVAGAAVFTLARRLPPPRPRSRKRRRFCPTRRVS